MIRRTLCLLVCIAGCAAQSQRRPAATVAQRFMISGTVVDEVTNAPLAEAEVGLATEDSPEMLQQGAVTAKDGRFSFVVSAAAKYALSADRSGYISQHFDEHEGFWTSVVTGPGQDTRHLVFRMLPAADIRGRVVDEHGDPVPEAAVTLFRSGYVEGRRQTGKFALAQTDSNGEYRFQEDPPVPPGTYYLLVTARVWYAVIARMTRPPRDMRLRDVPGYSELERVFSPVFFADQADPEHADAIMLKPGQHLVADFRLASISGAHVRIAAGNYYVTLARQFFDSDAEPVPAYQQNTGPFTEIEGIAAGNYEAVIVRQMGNEPRGPRRLKEGEDPQIETRRITIAGDTDLDFSEPIPGVDLRGKLAGKDRPKEVTVLRLHTYPAGETFVTVTAPSGEFRFPQLLPPGKYLLTLLSANNLFAKPRLAEGARVKGDIVELGDAKKAVLDVDVVQGASSVAGFIRRGLAPAPGAMVLLVPDDPERNPNLFRREQSNTDGSFSIRNVVAGRYTLVAIQDGWDLEWDTLPVLAKYLVRGERLEVGPNVDLTLKIAVQERHMPAF